MKSTISAIIIAYNEEKNISDCLASVSFADEIVVIDNESTDGTSICAKKFTKHVFVAKRVGYVEPIRNFALTKATGDWILFLDADEQIPETLAKKLRQIVDEDFYDAVQIPRKNIIFNKWIEHAGWWPDNLLRFFKKDMISWPEEIHVQPTLPERTVTLEPISENAILHQNYQTISHYLQKLDTYTTVQAKERIAAKVNFRIHDLLTNPVKEYISRFFAREGYKDGLHGFVLSLLQGFSELIVMLKIWEIQGFKEYSNILTDVEKERKVAESEMTYWLLSTQIQHNKNPFKKILLKGKRKLSS